MVSDWSILYVIIVSFVIVIVLTGVTAALVCVINRCVRYSGENVAHAWRNLRVFLLVSVSP